MRQSKKIFDIFPPKKLEIEKPPKISFESKIGTPPFWQKKKFKEISISFLVILFLAGIFSYFTLSKAEIEIWPETETLNLEQKIAINKEIDQADPALWVKGRVIPGEIIETEIGLSQQFPSSGKTLKRAEGKIRLYNRYTTNPEVWRVGTRFISPEGKIFKSKSKISVPGAKLEKGKLIPSYTDVEVVAVEPGADYNIGPTKFAIYVYRGTPRYTEYWGESSESMTGGGEVLQVTQEDLDQAKNTLVEKLFKEGEIALKNKVSEDYILLDKALTKEIIEASSMVKAGAELESFNFQVKIGSQALIFKKSNIENFTKEYILSQIPKDKKLHQESLVINYSPENIDLELGKIILNLEITAKIYSDINLRALKEALKGKSLAATQILLENQPEVTKVEVNFWPFWVKNTPKNPEKIKLKLNIDPVEKF